MGRVYELDVVWEASIRVPDRLLFTGQQGTCAGPPLVLVVPPPQRPILYSTLILSCVAMHVFSRLVVAGGALALCK
jgi:hypothetical protein